MGTYPKLLCWVDIETTGLPVANDFSGVEVLEMAVLVTDMDLNKLDGYTEVLPMTQAAAAALRANDYVRQMHLKSGLVAECIGQVKAHPEITLRSVEDEIFAMLSERGAPGEYMIAGSGVGAFDHPLIKEKLPKMAKYFAYFSFDVGVLRRTSKILAGRDVVNPTIGSYGDTKVHRAWQDVESHLAEAWAYREYFRR